MKSGEGLRTYHVPIDVPTPLVDMLAVPGGRRAGATTLVGVPANQTDTQRVLLRLLLLGGRGRGRVLDLVYIGDISLDEAVL